MGGRTGRRKERQAEGGETGQRERGRDGSKDILHT